MAPLTSIRPQGCSQASGVGSNQFSEAAVSLGGEATALNSSPHPMGLSFQSSCIWQRRDHRQVTAVARRLVARALGLQHRKKERPTVEPPAALRP